MQDTVEKQSHDVSKLKKELLLFALSFIFTFSFNVLFMQAINSGINLLEILIYSLATLLILSICFYNWQSSVISSILFAVVILALYYLPPFQDSFRAALDGFLSNLQLAADEFMRFIDEGLPYLNSILSPTESLGRLYLARLAMVIIAVTAFLVIQKMSTYSIIWILSILLLTFAVLMEIQTSLLWMIPILLVAVFLTLLSSGNLINLLKFSNSGKHLSRATGQLAALLVIAILLSIFFSQRLTHTDIYSPYWQGVVDDVITIFPEAFQTDLTVNTFSIAGDGFYPMGDRLGGSIELADRDVASIQGSSPQLVKVQSADTYDGFRWTRTVNNPNYRYDSPFNSGAENEVFNSPANSDFFELLGMDSDAVYDTFSYSLRPEVAGTQVIFTSGSPYQLRSSREEALLFYFNQAGTIYAKTTFDNEHFYNLSTFIPDAESMGITGSSGNSGRLNNFDEAASDFNAANLELNNQVNAYENYLQVPQVPAYQEGSLVYETALSVTEGTSGPYSTIQAIYSFFKHNPDFTYSLEVPTPPDNMDFVEHFLQTLIGYCTYYASAFTLFARLNGIPARYVEGYSLTPENMAELAAGDETMINSLNAHAWSEVYLDGIGWVAIDPTPGMGESEEPEPTTTPEPTETTTTTTEAEVTTTTTSIDTTTTTSSEDDVTTTTQEDTEDSNTFGQVLRVLGIILLILLILAASIFLLWFYYKKRKEYIASLHDKDNMLERIPNKLGLVNFYWYELLELQRILSDFKPASSATEAEIASLLEEHIKELENNEELSTDTELSTSPNNPVNWHEVTAIVAESRYSRHNISDDKLDRLASEFDKLEDHLQAELSEFAYLTKRVLPPNQGKINR